MKKTNHEQRVCRLCRTIFMGQPSENTCPRCVESTRKTAEIQEKVRRQTAAPVNPYVECLIQRDGNTTVCLQGYNYTFKANDSGHFVCLITNPKHHQQLVEQKSLYRVYEG